jgi:hypothetical protein
MTQNKRIVLASRPVGEPKAGHQVQASGIDGL